MIANYGYTDGSGEFFITVNTGKCETCTGKPCIKSCPKQIFVEIEDDYGEIVMAVKETARKNVKYECADCKPSKDRPPLPCVSACPFEAIKHSW